MPVFAGATPRSELRDLVNDSHTLPKLHIAKTTHWYVQHSLFWAVVTCVHFLHKQRRANMSTTLCTGSLHRPRKFASIDCTGAPAAQSLLGDLGFLTSPQKSKLSWGGGRGMTILNCLTSWSSWHILARADTACDTEPGLSTSTGIKPRHQYCFKTQSIFGHSAHTSQVLL